MTNKVIGITGKAGTGKDTAAQMLVDLGYVQYSLAGPLKAGLNAMFGFTPEQWNNRVWKETVIPALGASPRYLAQTLGTEWGRELVKDTLWLDLAKEFVLNSDKPVVISDVRFENEAQLVTDLGGSVVKLSRDTTPVSEHVSEQEFVPYTHHIFNEGSFDTLRLAITSVSIGLGYTDEH